MERGARVTEKVLPGTLQTLTHRATRPPDATLRSTDPARPRVPATSGRTASNGLARRREALHRSRRDTCRATGRSCPRRRDSRDREGGGTRCRGRAYRPDGLTSGEPGRGGRRRDRTARGARPGSGARPPGRGSPRSHATRRAHQRLRRRAPRSAARPVRQTRRPRPVTHSRPGRRRASRRKLRRERVAALAPARSGLRPQPLRQRNGRCDHRAGQRRAANRPQRPCPLATTSLTFLRSRPLPTGATLAWRRLAGPATAWIPLPPSGAPRTLAPPTQ